MGNEEIVRKKWVYILPDGSKENNMKDAKIKLGISKVKFVGMLKSGRIKKMRINESELLKGYEHTKRTT